MPEGSNQSTPQGSQPGAPQSQTPSTGATDPSGAQAGQTPAASAPVTEGCLGGSKAAYTITDKGGKTYKLNLPANADASPLASHVGESVMVMGSVNSAGGSPTIDVQKIGRGTGTCPGSSAAPQSH